MKKKMLLHSCCAPCTSGVVGQLEDYDITLLFYNPNLDSLEEYNKRLDALYTLVNKMNDDFKYNLKVIAIPYNHAEFIEKTEGLENEPEGGNRCTKCIDLRLDFTAKYAKENGYEMFATTLSVSPHKNHILINTLGNNASIKYNMTYLESNFKKNDGFLNSIKLSKKYSIYRQRYCGCTPTLNQS